MKLTLKNFRCYVDSVFDFGNDGLTLITGGSGRGKTTLMMAIEFALFGTGTKLQTHGKRTCSVELEMDGLKIFRQKAPNRLIVNEIYEDAAGEPIIANRFGNNMLTCYIPQNTRKTLVLMTPAERLEFLEGMVSSGTDISDVKTSTKTLIKVLTEQHSELVGELRGIQSVITSLELPPKPKFHSTGSLEDQLATIEKITKRVTEAKKLVATTTVKLKALQDQKTALTLLTRVLSEKTSRLTELKLELNPDVVAGTSLDSLTKEIATTKAVLASAVSFSRLKQQEKDLCKTIEQLQSSDDNELSEKITKIEASLWELMSKSEATKQLDLWKHEASKKTTRDLFQKELGEMGPVTKPANEVQRVEQLRHLIDELKKKIEIENFPLVKCPDCGVEVRFTGDCLVKSDCRKRRFSGENSTSEQLTEHQRELDSLTQSISKQTEKANRVQLLQSKIKAVGVVDETADESYAEIVEYISQNKQNELALAQLKEEQAKPSKTIHTLTERLELIKRGLANEKEGDVDELGLALRQLETQKAEIEREISKRQKVLDQISKIEKEVKALDDDFKKKFSQDNSDGNLDNLIVENSSIVETTTEKIKEDVEKISKFTKSAEYTKALSKVEQFTAKKTLVETKEEDVRTRLSSACTFKDKILEAESIAITSMINTMNTHAQVYLESFFPDDPISVRLVAFKETKKTETTKPQINLEIDYKGVDHDLSMLSGGEQSRVILAFTLALAEIHNTPFVLLDESTSALDQELTNSVVESLKDNYGKLTIIIAHQVIQGVFDRVVKI